MVHNRRYFRIGRMIFNVTVLIFRSLHKVELDVRIMQDRRAFENPFDSNNRNHFPGYSPMFRIKKTASPEVRSGNWIVSSTTITGCVPDGKLLHEPSPATRTGPMYFVCITIHLCSMVWCMDSMCSIWLLLSDSICHTRKIPLVLFPWLQHTVLTFRPEISMVN